MPGGFPIGAGLSAGASIVPGISSGLDGIVLTASGSTNTKGSYTQLIAATTSDACAAVVTLNLILEAAATSSVDIAVGASGSEHIIIPDLICPLGGDTILNTSSIMLPVNIPAGSRIAARTQCSTASKTVGISMQLFDGAIYGHEGAGGVDAIGFSSAATVGTAVVAGSQAKSAYVQLTAATARDYRGIFIATDAQSSNSNGTSRRTFYDIAIGASGSEQIIIPDWSNMTWAGLCVGYFSPFFEIEIPAGTRIAVAAGDTQSGTATTGVTVYGVYQ